MFWAYLLRCADGRHYCGHTDDLKLQMAQYDSGKAGGYTAGRLPVELMWSATFPSREQAFAAQRQIKGWSRAKKEALIRGDWSRVSLLAKHGMTLPDDASTGATPADDALEDDEKPADQPIIVLVRPQLGENIGKAARAMLNFGFKELRLVAPRDGWPNPRAGPAAAGADMVLEYAQVYDTTAEAVADCANVYATTVRKRGVTKPVLTPEAAATQIASEAGPQCDPVRS